MNRRADIPVILVSLFLFVSGFHALFSMRMSLLPARMEPVITIVTEYHEMEPDIVDEIITRPLEGVLKEVKGIKSSFSYSSRGMSRIVAFLKEGERVDEKAILIEDALHPVADRFPDEIRRPALYKYNTDESPVMILSLTPHAGRAGAWGTGDFDAFVEQTLRAELLSVEGVANVETAGARKEEIFVEQRYEDLVRIGGDCETLFAEIARGSVQVPLGAIDHGSERVTLSYPNKYADFSALTRTRLQAGGGTIHGGDLLVVRSERRAEERVSFVNNAPALTLYLFKKDIAGILEIDKGVRKTLSRRRDVLDYRVLYDQAEGFRSLLLRLGLAAAISIACGFLVTLFFYGSVVCASLAVVALSASFMTAVTLLMLVGRSMNVMSLSGVIAGIGPCMGNGLVLIDEAVKTAREDGGPSDAADAAARAARPVLTVTSVLIVLFVPLYLFGGGFAGVDADFALSASVMSASSAFVALLLLPAIIRVFKIRRLSRRRRKAVRSGAVLASLLSAGTGMKRKTLILLLCACAVAGSVFFIVDRGYEDLPPLEENAFELYFDFDPEYNSGYKRGALLTIGEEIRSMGMPITLVSKLEGTRATFLLKFPRGYRGLERDAGRLKERLSRLRRDDGFFSFQTGKEAGVRSILLYFFGDERKLLEATVDEAAETCSGVPGVTQVLKGYREGKTELVFTVEPSRMYSAGTNVSEVIGFLRYVFYFPVILKHYTGEKVIDVRGKVAVDGLRKEGIRSIGIVFGEGKRAVLGDFSTLSNSRSSPVISRKNGKRFISLDLRYENAGEDDVMDAVLKRLKEVPSGHGGYYEFDEKHLEAKRNRLLVTASLALALFLSYVVLGTATNSFAWPLRMILVAPASLVGGAAFLAAGGYARSASVNVGIIILIALSLTAPLLVVDEHLRSGRKRGEAPQGRIVLQACAERLRVLTAVTLVTALSMAPVFLLSGPANFFAVMCGFVLSGEASAYFIFLAVFPNLCSRAPEAGRPPSPEGEI